MIDWHGMLYPTDSVLEIVIRGSVMYLLIFIFMRVILKRQTGSMGVTDLLLITLLADASQNGMADEYRSLTEGIALVLTIIFWAYALDWLSYQSEWFRKLIEPQPLLLVHNGRMLKDNMHRELITVDDLMSQLRGQGIDNIADVARAMMERNGNISVIKREATKL